MDSLFEKSVFDSLIDRIEQLQPTTHARWGTMGVAQMFAHLHEAFTVPLQTKQHKRMMLGYIFGRYFKSKAIDDSPIAKNLKTVPGFLVTTIKEFTNEKKLLIESILTFHNKKAVGIGTVSHPFFGKLTGEEWGKGMNKHVDYHLKQFGV